MGNGKGPDGGEREGTSKNKERGQKMEMMRKEEAVVKDMEERG